MASPPGNWVTLDAAAKLPRVVLTTPWAPSDVPLVGLVANSLTKSHSVWHFHARSDATTRDLSRLLALILLHEEEPVLPFLLMPERPPTGYLLRTGAVRRGRGFLFAPWAEREMKRLSACLIAAHSGYLESLSAALRQQDTPAFTRPKPGFFFRDHYESSRVGPLPQKIPVDVSSIPRIRHRTDPYQGVAHDYHYNRYLVLLSDEELARRTEDIVGNLHIVDENGLVSFEREDPARWYWFSLLTELQVEMSLRHGPYPAGWDKKLIDLRNAAAPSLYAANGIPLPSLQKNLSSPLNSPFIVKYGRAQFLERAFHKGQIRVFPASTYHDPSLNTAVRDDELSARLYIDPSVPFNDVAPGTIIFPAGRQHVNLEARSNYYVYCMSQRLTNRLLYDFGGDACLVIRDPGEFVRRFTAAARQVLPDFDIVQREVEYYDPLLVQPTEVNILFSKHFRYAYQQEVRIALVPREPVKRLAPIDLELGGLQDITELVVRS